MRRKRIKREYDIANGIVFQGNKLHGSFYYNKMSVVNVA